MFSHFRKLMLGVGLGAMMLAPIAAHAGLMVQFDGPPIQSPGYFPGYSQYSYELTSDPTTYLTAGDHFTISGITGLFNALAPANFTASIPVSGSVEYTYSGANTSTSLDITGFEVNTIPGYNNIGGGSYTAVGTSAGGAVTSGGGVQVPSAVPEPRTAFFFPIALLAGGAFFHFTNRCLVRSSRPV